MASVTSVCDAINEFKRLSDTRDNKPGLLFWRSTLSLAVRSLYLRALAARYVRSRIGPSPVDR